MLFRSVFSGPPVMSYIPPNSQVEIIADAAADLGIFSAPSNAHIPAALMEGATVTRKQVGRENWQRTVYSALDQNVPAERLLAGETLNPPGNWSSFPPHKHDRSNPPQDKLRPDPPPLFAMASRAACNAALAIPVLRCLLSTTEQVILHNVFVPFLGPRPR